MSIPRVLATTVDNGSLHVAIDEKYQGKINSYNNWFTQFFAKFFGWTVEVSFGHDTFLLDKQDYRQFLERRNVNVIGSIQNYRVFTQINFLINESGGFMRHALTAQKADRLGREMIRAQLRGDVTSAASYLRQGASVDELVWYRDRDKKPFFAESFAPHLPYQALPAESYERRTPLLIASILQQADLFGLLQQFGADTQKEGEACHFQRDYLGGERRGGAQLVTRPELVRVYGTHRGYRHTPTVRHEVQMRLGVDRVSTLITQFRDVQFNRVKFNLGGVLALPNIDSVITKQETTVYPFL